MKRRIALTLFMTAAVAAAFPAVGHATTIEDPDDVGRRLDIHSASLVQISSDRLQVTIVFWDRTPTWLLRRGAARIETSDKAPSHAKVGGVRLGFRFWRNDQGRLRLVYGEPASNCCGHHRAQHPDPFTYTATIRLSLDNFSTKSFRGATTRRLSCDHERACGLDGGRLLDRTRWRRV